MVLDRGSTDSLAGRPLDEVTLTDEVTEFEVQIYLHRDRDPWAFSVSGPFPYDMVSTTCVSGYLAVNGSARFDVDKHGVWFAKSELALPTEAAFDLLKRSLNTLF